MFLCNESYETWQRSGLDQGGPYEVWKSPAMPWWCVCDRLGNNVLTQNTGRVFTDQETAERLTEEWNSQWLTKQTA